MAKDYDIIIVGAGLVGTSLAVALQGQGLRVALLEKNLANITHSQRIDTRPISLAYASYVVLKTLGVWQDLASEASPIKAVHVSDQGALGITHFKASEMNVPALGYVVPFSVLQQRLYAHTVADANVTVLSIDALGQVQCDESGASVFVETKEGRKTLAANLLVATDGANSSVREQLNIAVTHRDAAEVAVTAEIMLEKPHDGTAYERFTSQGVWALLPLLDQYRYRLVWTLPGNEADAVSSWSDERFQAAIEDSFLRRIGKVKLITRGSSHPLKTMLAKEQIRPGVVLLGNAAHTLYPLAAQGFNLGLRDVATLAEVLIAARHQGQSLSDFSILQSYGAWSKTHQETIINLTQGIADVFGLQIPLINKARGLGLLATDLIPPLKKRIARRTMGLAGRVPKLARGIALS